MWIFISSGFVSAVRHREKPSTILLRARVRQHLDEFVGLDCRELVYRVPGSDYQYRAEISELQLCTILINYVSGLNYDNFKKSINTTYNLPYKRVCSSVWAVLADAYGAYTHD